MFIAFKQITCLKILVYLQKFLEKIITDNVTIKILAIQSDRSKFEPQVCHLSNLLNFSEPRFPHL